VQRQIRALADQLLTLATAKGKPTPKPRVTGTDSRTFSGEATKRRSRTSRHEATGDPRTRDYVARQFKKNKSKASTLQMLKRAVAREMFRLLTHQIPSPTTATSGRPAKPITSASSPPRKSSTSGPNIISRLERGLYRNDTMADQTERG
jgi:transposase